MIPIYDATNTSYEVVFQRVTEPAEEGGQSLEKIEEEVRQVLAQVKERGDQALREYTEKWDGVTIDHLLVSPEEMVRAKSQVSPELLSIMEEAAANIREFHQLQKRQDYELKKEAGVLLGQKTLPLGRVGIYVPGGTASYPSSVLMNAIPATIAGVSEIVMITPPGKDGNIFPVILAAAQIAGVTQVIKVGGAQGIAALAYGTQSIPKVDKITGPGNIYVATAKKMVFGEVDIDMVAGPSEILIIADDQANPAHVAADLLSQAEHDVRAAAVLLTPRRNGSGKYGKPGENCDNPILGASHGVEQSVRTGAFGAGRSRSLPLVGKGTERWSGILGASCSGSLGGLFCRHQPCVAHWRNRPV
jgi:histidinol dehydrogenase